MQFGINVSIEHPRTVGAAPDETSFHYGQRNFDLNNPPAIIYQLKPLTVWTRFNTTHGFRAIIEPKLDAQGNTMYEQWPEEGKAPRQLRDLPILPDQISTKEHWLYLECVRRIDPRVNFHDIAMRMHRNGRLATTSLQARGQNKREANGMLSWHQSRPGDQKFTRGPAKAVLAKLAPAQVAANTTRGLTPKSFDPVSAGVAPPPAPDAQTTTDDAES